MEPFKEMQRDTWSAGDYASLSPYIADVGERVVEHAGIEPGARVLDVACGTGNAAKPAAEAGAEVTGLDLAPPLIEAGRRQAAELGLSIQFVEGDAENLPFEDESFDRVLSTFGHMFAPRHRRTADEMRRVCAPDGALVVACWTPEGTVGELFAASAPYAPPPPDDASPPILWGTEDHVREMFEGASHFEFGRYENVIEWESPEAFVDFFAERFPPLVTAQRNLGERWPELRGVTLDVFRRRNTSEDGKLVLPQEYLLSVVRL